LITCTKDPFFEHDPVVPETDQPGTGLSQHHDRRVDAPESPKAALLVAKLQDRIDARELVCLIADVVAGALRPEVRGKRRTGRSAPNLAGRPRYPMPSATI